MPDDANVQTLDQESEKPAYRNPEDAALMEKVVETLKTIYDPEIPVDIWELGLIYRVDVDSEKNVQVDMTLTAPSCPVAGEMPGQVQMAIENLDEVKSCRVELVWEPPWHPGMMSEDARIALDMF